MNKFKNLLIKYSAIIILCFVMFGCSTPFVPSPGSVEIIPKGDSSWINSIATSYDGKFLAYGGGNNNVYLWDIEKGELLHTFKGHSDYVNLVVFSPDSQYIASGSQDNTVKLWNRQQEKLMQSFEGNSNCVNSVIFSPDGKFFVYGGEDNTVHLWDIKRKVLLKTFERHSGCVSPIAFSLDSKFVIHGGTDGIVKILDLSTNETIVSLVTFEDDEWIAYIPNGYYASSEKGDKEIAFKVQGKLYDRGDDEEYNKCTSIYKRPDRIAHILGSSGSDSAVATTAFPPDLHIKRLKFIEPSGNKALDGNEAGTIQFNVVNKGRGDANNLQIKLTPLTSSNNLSFNNSKKIMMLKPKKLENVTIPINADMNVRTMKREFRIDVLEASGFDSEPATISFQTQAFAAPDLKIKQIAIDDSEDMSNQEGASYGDGDSIIEPGETIEVVAYVQNFGKNLARDVKAKIILKPNTNITCPAENKIFNLGNIPSNDYGKKIEFYFFTNKHYSEKNIPFSIELTESHGQFGNTCDLGLKMHKKMKNIHDITILKAKSETKEQKQISVLDDEDVDQNIPEFDVNGEDTLVIIIGIEKYKYAPTATYASNDAKIFYEYAKSVFGIPEKNIYYRINDEATSGEFNKIFAQDGWIERRIQEDETDVIIYYSGHGAPDPKSKKGYLIPHDIDPNYATTGFSLDDIYSSLSRLEAKSVTVFLDACFSGESRSEQMLLADTRPISIQIEHPALKTENMAVITASARDQYSCAYPEQEHGLFTYYLLKGLRGNAKGDDNKLTLEELYEFIKKNVSKTAGYLDKEQTPTFIGRDDSRILLKF